VELDPLTGATGVGTRAAFRDVVQRLDHPFALLLVDIDDMKTFCDEQGLSVGDQLLIDVARALRSFVPGVFRVGGDEFVAVITGTADDGIATGEAMRCAVRSLDYRSSRGPLSVKVGVAASELEMSSETVLIRADIAMQAGQGVGDCVTLYDVDVHRPFPQEPRAPRPPP